MHPYNSSHFQNLIIQEYILEATMKWRTEMDEYRTRVKENKENKESFDVISHFKLEYECPKHTIEDV